MAPLLKLLQESPVELAFCALILLLASCFAAHSLIYIGLRTLGVPAELARSMLISIHRYDAEPESVPELRPVPQPPMIGIARAGPIQRPERNVA